MEGVEMNKGFEIYAGKRILITGATGFKGTWLTKILRTLNAEVTGFGLKPDTNPSLYEIFEYGKEGRIIIRDILEKGFAEKIIEGSEPEIIFHLASQPLVSVSYKEPAETFRTNIFGLINLYEAVRSAGTVKNLVIITSDKCYDTERGIKIFKEEDPMGGLDPYSASKGCAEVITKSYYKSFLENEGISLVTARAGNIIGGGDWSKDRLIPDIVRAVTGNRRIVLRNPNSVRPWQHVFDALFGYLTIGGKLLTGELSGYYSYNFGPTEAEEFTVADVAGIFAEKFGIGRNEITYVNPEFHETEYLRLDSTKVYKEAGWRCIWSTKESIEKTAEWYGAYKASKESAVELSGLQLDYYLKDMADRNNISDSYGISKAERPNRTR